MLITITGSRRHWEARIVLLPLLLTLFGFDHDCTCIKKNGRNTVCRTCGSACHCGQ